MAKSDTLRTLALCALAWAAAPLQAEQITLTESGSSLMFPLFSVWVSEYAKTHQGVQIDTRSSGSADGIERAESGAVQIGASDAYMSDEQVRKNPHMLNIAMAISALTVNYNLPGLNSQPLRLDGPTLSGIYSGKIRHWDDAPIAGLNPGRQLPHREIITLRRAEGSGDTFVFTQYLSFSTPSWEDNIGYGTSVNWPQVPGGLTASGNKGLVDLLAQTPYAIGYVGISYRAALEQAKLGTAQLKSYSGEFLLPTPASISAAAAALTPRTPPDERLTLVNAPGTNAYPLVNYEYAIVSSRQTNPATAEALRKFLLWASAPDETNDRFLQDANFIPLPAHIWVISHDQIESIR
jgi:phosphate transport system substrate-binding protein